MSILDWTEKATRNWSDDTLRRVQWALQIIWWASICWFVWIVTSEIRAGVMKRLDQLDRIESQLYRLRKEMG